MIENIKKDWESSIGDVYKEANWACDYAQPLLKVALLARSFCASHYDLRLGDMWARIETELEKALEELENLENET